jgi:hypothetical protein
MQLFQVCVKSIEFSDLLAPLPLVVAALGLPPRLRFGVGCANIGHLLRSDVFQAEARFPRCPLLSLAGKRSLGCSVTGFLFGLAVEPPHLGPKRS